MRKNLLITVLSLITVLLFTACGETTTVKTDVPTYIKKESSIFSTNLDGISITPYSPGKDSKIEFPDGREEKVTQDYIALFVNGSLIENAGIFIKNDRIVAPVAMIIKSLHLGNEWNVITRKLTVFDGDKIVEVFVDDKKIKIGEELIELEMYPEIVEDRLYASSEFFKKALGVEVSYYNGIDENATKIIPGLRQVMFSRYPVDEETITVEEALKFVKDDVITAYEKSYSKYVPLGEGAEYDKNDEGESIRAGLRDLYVITANDRFYVMHLKSDILVDKYTGEVFTLVKNDPIVIKHYNPYSEDALKFQ